MQQRQNLHLIGGLIVAVNDQMAADRLGQIGWRQIGAIAAQFGVFGEQIESAENIADIAFGPRIPPGKRRIFFYLIQNTVDVLGE